MQVLVCIGMYWYVLFVWYVLYILIGFVLCLYVLVCISMYHMHCVMYWYVLCNSLYWYLFVLCIVGMVCIVHMDRNKSVFICIDVYWHV